jgi:hypothetical protein
MSRRQILYIQKTDAVNTTPNQGCQKRDAGPPPITTASQNKYGDQKAKPVARQ